MREYCADQRAYASHVSTCCRPLRASATSGASCHIWKRVCKGQKTGTHDDSILLDSPYLVSSIGPVLKGSHRWTPGRTLFRIQSHRLSGTFPHKSESLEAGRFGAVSNERLRSVHRLEQQIPKPSRCSETRKVAATFCPKRAARNTPAVGAPRASLHFSKLRATTSWTPSGIAPRSISWAWCGTCVSAHVFRSHILGVGQVPGEPGRHPSLLAHESCKCVCVCVFVAAHFVSQHTSHKPTGVILRILSVCDRNRLP